MSRSLPFPAGDDRRRQPPVESPIDRNLTVMSKRALIAAVILGSLSLLGLVLVERLLIAR